MPQPLEVSISTAVTSQRRPRAAAWWLFSPLLAWLAIFVVAPTAILFVYSFCQRDELGQVVFSFTTENYRRIVAANDDFEEPLTAEQRSRMSLMQRWHDFFNRRVYLKISLRSIVYAAETTVF